MKSDWDAAKAKGNRRKHGVSFDEAKTVFGNDLYLQDYDAEHSDEEDRWRTVGVSEKSRVLVIVTTEHHGDVVWIISARKATRVEAQKYEEEIKNRSGR